MKRINVIRSSMPSFEEYCNEIKDLWDSHWLTNMGEKHQRLQEKLQETLQSPCVTLFANGHLALENLIEALQLPPQGEVITTPFTFASTTHAIVRKGLVPVFCDVKPDDYTLDPTKIEALITPRTCAILPVHVYGNLCDVKAIQRIAQEHHLNVIYDAAHAFGVTLDGRSVATFGDAAMFSFHATKVFNTIEGGAVCTDNQELTERLNNLKNFGIKGPERCVAVGGNAKMNEFQAAMGLCNLRHICQDIQRRKQLTLHYRQRLNSVPGLKLCREPRGVTPNYAYLPVVFDGFDKSRDQAFELLQRHDIYTRKYFYPLTNDFECYRKLPTAGKEKTPIAAFLADRVLTLPLYADLTLEDVDRICDTLLQ